MDTHQEQPDAQVPEVKAADTPVPTSEIKQTKPSFLRSRKSLILLVIVVLMVGGILALTRSKPVSPPQEKVISKAVPLFLTLESPTDQTLVQDATLVIKGKTTPNTIVAFYTDAEDGSVQSDTSGNFSGSLPLQDGINTLTVTAFGENGEEKTTSLDVVYDPEGGTAQ